MKNACGKTRKIENPYEIWVTEDHPLFGGRCEYRVLKKYQTPEQEAKNPFARWFVGCASTCTYGTFELGDCYISEICQAGARRTYNEAVDGPKTFPKSID